MLSSRRGGGTCSSKAASNHSHLDSLLTLTCCSEGKEICLPDPQTLFWGLPYYFPNSFQMWRPYPAILFFPHSLPFPLCFISFPPASWPGDPRTRLSFGLPLSKQNPVLWIASAWRVCGEVCTLYGVLESSHCHILAHLFLIKKQNKLLLHEFSDSWQPVMHTARTWSLLHVPNLLHPCCTNFQIFIFHSGLQWMRLALAPRK